MVLEGQSVCAICAGDGSMQDPASVVGCQHSFCYACISTWTNSRRDPPCPLCGSPITALRRADGSEEAVAQPLGAVTQPQQEPDLACLDHGYFRAEVNRVLQHAVQIQDRVIKANSTLHIIGSNSRYSSSRGPCKASTSAKHFVSFGLTRAASAPTDSQHGITAQPSPLKPWWVASCHTAGTAGNASSGSSSGSMLRPSASMNALSNRQPPERTSLVPAGQGASPNSLALLGTGAEGLHGTGASLALAAALVPAAPAAASSGCASIPGPQQEQSSQHTQLPQDKDSSQHESSSAMASTRKREVELDLGSAARHTADSRDDFVLDGLSLLELYGHLLERLHVYRRVMDLELRFEPGPVLQCLYRISDALSGLAAGRRPQCLLPEDLGAVLPAGQLQALQPHHLQHHLASFMQHSRAPHVPHPKHNALTPSGSSSAVAAVGHAGCGLLDSHIDADLGDIARGLGCSDSGASTTPLHCQQQGRPQLHPQHLEQRYVWERLGAAYACDYDSYDCYEYQEDEETEYDRLEEELLGCAEGRSAGKLGGLGGRGGGKGRGQTRGGRGAKQSQGNVGAKPVVPKR